MWRIGKDEKKTSKTLQVRSDWSSRLHDKLTHSFLKEITPHGSNLLLPNAGISASNEVNRPSFQTILSTLHKLVFMLLTFCFCRQSLIAFSHVFSVIVCWCLLRSVCKPSIANKFQTGQGQRFDELGLSKKFEDADVDDAHVESLQVAHFAPGAEAADGSYGERSK